MSIDGLRSCIRIPRYIPMLRDETFVEYATGSTIAYEPLSGSGYIFLFNWYPYFFL